MKINVKRSKIACDENLCFVLPVQFTIKSSPSTITPLHDICLSEDYIYIIISLPGVDNSTLNLLYENNSLLISGKIPFPLSESYVVFNHKENSYGSFEKRITLPCQIESDSIDATLKNGLLVIKAKIIRNKNSRKIPITP